MNAANIGIDTDDLQMRPKDALRKTSALGFRMIELSVADRELDPANLSASGRRHLAKLTESLGLTIGVLSADVPGLRLTDPRTVDERVERTRRILDLARDLNVRLVTASAGALTHPESGDPSPVAVEALTRLGEYADARGVHYALRPSHDNAERVERVLGAVRCPALQIGLDPGGIVMSGANPMSIVQRLPMEIALLHARDGTMGLADRPGTETRFGEGEVDFLGLLALLGVAEFEGPCILRRTSTANPAGDLVDGREALLRILPSR